MPTPKKGEPKKKFIKRCIPYMFHNEPETLTSDDKKSGQAFAICNSLYKRKKKKTVKESFETFEKTSDRRIQTFDDFNEGKKDKFNPHKEVRKKHREDRLDSGADLRTKYVPDKNKRIPSKRVSKHELQDDED